MKAVLALSLLACALAASPFATVSFCDKYTTAVFSTNTAGNQLSLLRAVMDRATGFVQANQTQFPNTAGVFYTALNRPFFTGTYGSGGHANYTNAALNLYIANPVDGSGGLREGLVKFFGFLLGCNLYMDSLTPPYTPPIGGTSNLKTIHAGMNLNIAIFNEFFGQVANTLASFGVDVATTGPKNEQAYLVAMFNVLKLEGPLVDPAAGLQVCNQQDCGPALDFNVYQHTPSPFSWFSQLAPPQKNITLTVDRSVAWRYSATIHNVEETDATYTVSTPTPFGFRSGPSPDSPTGAQVYTQMFDGTKLGMHYFVCAAHGQGTGTMRGSINVIIPSSAGALAASVAVLFAAIAASLSLSKL